MRRIPGQFERIDHRVAKTIVGMRHGVYLAIQLDLALLELIAFGIMLLAADGAEIRAYVDAVRQANATSNNPMSAQEFRKWAEWALAQADRIDPILSGQYRIVCV